MIFCASFINAVAVALTAKFVAGVAADGQLLQRANKNPPTLVISNPVLTSKWIEGSNYTQIIEILVTNTHATNYATLVDTVKITASSDSFELIVPAAISRLATNQSVVVQLGVRNKAGIVAGQSCSGTVVATWGGTYGPLHSSSANITGSCGFGDYAASKSSLAKHSSPDWFNNAKYGIFIQWGPSSAPAYGSVAPNEDYSEWYWKRMNDPTYKTQTYQYHNETYGEKFNYDDFISNFTDAKWDPKAWVDLVAAAGAQYIVPITKHHDGFALFNFSTSISMRSSIHLGPKRDIIGDLLNASKKYHPEIRRGTYFSLPEWYNPAYKRYAYSRGGGFPGGPPTNPYTGAILNYTGYVPVDDFILDIQLPQQNVLAYDYETELMWCDIAGSANNASIFASQWINWARDHGRQVTFNSRCGLAGDFDTPEYATFSNTAVRKWESNRGMDPFSFAFNYQTPNSSYMTGKDIVVYLVDTVSKNGNFLLDIGPRNDGSIPEIMQKGLLDAGAWISAHAESIFNTRFWETKPGSDPFRYSTTADAFYIHVNSEPTTIVTINDPIPYLPGDTVSVVGGGMNGTEVTLDWNNHNGTFSLYLTDEIIAADDYVWTFKIAYTSNS